MFFKWRKWRAEPWREQVQRLQRRYTRRLADWVNRKVALVPVKKMRLYVMIALAGMIVLDGAMALHIIRRYRGGPEAAELTRWELRPVLPFKSWDFNDKLCDSLEKVRPGLADSLKMLESLH
jgi:hypothetical protein